MQMLIAVAAGGATGAVGRYLVMSQMGHWLGASFPYGTLVVNIVGSFILGALIEIMALVWSPSQEMRAFLVVGVLGAFTTFSTFSLDAVVLFERGEIGAAALYATLSVLLAVGGLLAGMSLFRLVLA
ncbi:MAG: fluoride efflux transporter CrcB [Alphaproteobacteria bacterium]